VNDDRLDENDLAALRRALEPDRRTVERTIEGALASPSVPRRRWLALSTAAAAFAAILLFIEIERRPPALRGARIEIRNSGSVILASDASGERWLVGGSGTTKRSGTQMIWMTKGAER
jgi:hypothetical protein